MKSQSPILGRCKTLLIRRYYLPLLPFDMIFYKFTVASNTMRHLNSDEAFDMQNHRWSKTFTPRVHYTHVRVFILYEKLTYPTRSVNQFYSKF